MSIPILPCEACGTKEFVYIRQNPMGWNTRGLECARCNSSGTMFYDVDDAIEDWNRMQRKKIAAAKIVTDLDQP
jgi:hypothetical protein